MIKEAIVKIVDKQDLTYAEASESSRSRRTETDGENEFVEFSQ